LTLFRRSPKPLLAIIALLVWCAAPAAADTQSAQSGDWSDPATWSTARVPGASDAVTIAAGDTVTYDLASSRVAGVTIAASATLVFDAQMDVALESSANVVVEGTLRLRPQEPNSPAHQNSSLDWSPYFIHTLRFVDVDETKFVGGGMDPLESDVGLWVMGEGVLDVAGAPKTGWVRLAGSALQGEDRITLDRVPVGWRNGDTIVIVPTEHPDVGERSWAGFEVRTVAAADGAAMRLDVPLAHDHPAVDDPFSGAVHTAEVLNLSRNVRIEGTGDGSASFHASDNGRAHVFIRSAVPQ
jgi:G8 domain